MIVTHQREKLLNAVLYFAENTRFCGKTKLMKLLCFLDFTHFRQTGRSVTGLEYYAWQRGPVPKRFFEELSGPLPADLAAAISVLKKGERFEQIVAKRRPDLRFFSPRELRIIEQLCEIWRDAGAEVISEISHFPNHPWDRTIKTKGEYGLIDYMLAVDHTGDSLPHAVIEERVRTREEMYGAFGRA